MHRTPEIRSGCVGTNTLSTAVDGDMKAWIEDRAERVGVTPTEYLRRLLDLYRKSVESSEVACPRCSSSVDLSPAVEQ